MNLGRKVLTGCAAALVALLLTACETPRPRPDARPAAAAAPRKMLDPAQPYVDLTAEELKRLWSHDLQQIAEGRGIRNVYVAGQTVVVETPDCTLLHLRTSTGVWIAATILNNPLSNPPAMGEDAMYATAGPSLLVIDPQSGEVRTRFRLRSATTCQPVPSGESVLFGGGNGAVSRFSTEQDRPLWKIRADGPVTEPPVLYEHRVYAAGLWGSVVAADWETGIVAWRWEPPSPSRLSSALAVADGKVYVGDTRSFVYCLPIQYGHPLWKYPTGGPVTGGPHVLEGGRLLVFTYEGDALCLELGEEPRLLWRHADAERLVATGKAGLLYLLTRDGGVACVAPETGEEKWRLELAPGCAVASDPSLPTFYVYRPGGAIMAVTEMD